jgi:S1-C subfamily serine protease
VREVVPRLSTGQSIERPYLGVKTGPPTDGSAGAEIAEVRPRGPASGAGLQGPAFQGGSGGDVIVTVDGKRVGAPEDVSTALTGQKRQSGCTYGTAPAASPRANAANNSRTTPGGSTPTGRRTRVARRA